MGTLKDACGANKIKVEVSRERQKHNAAQRCKRNYKIREKTKEYTTC